MSLIREIIIKDIINHENLLEKVLYQWNSRYETILQKLSSKYNINMDVTCFSESESELDNITNNKDIAFKLIKEAIKCKAYAETEYQSVKDIRSELEDCQMIKELGISLRKLEEENSEQNLKLKSLNDKNVELLQEKSFLELSLQKSKMAYNMSSQSRTTTPTTATTTTISMISPQKEYEDRKASLTAKLETLTNRVQNTKRINKNPDYCHIAPTINLFSDSEVSISEEDSLERDRNCDLNQIPPPPSPPPPPLSTIVAFAQQSQSTNIACPDQFQSGLKSVSKSTPIKDSSISKIINCDSPVLETCSGPCHGISNLTQDLKEIQKYFDIKKDNEQFVLTPTHILDWEMSQISFEEVKDGSPANVGHIDSIMDEKELRAADHHDAGSCCGNRKPENLDDPKQLQTRLKIEREKYQSLSNEIWDLFQLVQENCDIKVDLNDIPSCLGDCPSADPLEQIKVIKISISNKINGKEKANDTVNAQKSIRVRLIDKLMNKTFKKQKKNVDDSGAGVVKCNSTVAANGDHSREMNRKMKPFSDSRLQKKTTVSFNRTSFPTLKMGKNKTVVLKSDLSQNILVNTSASKDVFETNVTDEKIDNVSKDIKAIQCEDISTNIFKSLSETSVRLLTEMVTICSKINHLVSRNKVEILRNGMKDYTPLVTEYLQYLMSLDFIDFDSDNCKRHPIYDLLVNMEFNVKKLMETNSKVSNGETISQSLENYYQEQLNKCYDDINRLKQQLESSQQLFASKLPLDASQVLFETKQKFQTELESVDREYARQMARERKRLEESEILYNELLAEHEIMQKDFNKTVISFNQQIEQLERKIEAERKFIDQQQFEWELERSQHNEEIESLNRSLERIRKSPLCCNENLSSDCIDYSIRNNQKASSFSKLKCRRYSLESSEISCNTCATQTVFTELIIFKDNISVADLHRYDEFIHLRNEIERSQAVLLSIVQLFVDILFEIKDKNNLEDVPLKLSILDDFTVKDRDLDSTWHLFDCSHVQWKTLQSDIYKSGNVINGFIDDKIKLLTDLERLQEELVERNTNGLRMKEDVVTALEEEIQNLNDFQKNFSKDYDLLQTMLEEKQNELDLLSKKLISQPILDEQEELIRTLRKELTDQQNVIEERDEDLYVLKEQKELIEKELELVKERCESMTLEHGDMYQELEKELHESHRLKEELSEKLESFGARLSFEEREKELLNNQLCELCEENKSLVQKNTSLIDENQLSQLRLVEIKDQHKMEICKLNNNLEEMENENQKLIGEKKIYDKVALHSLGSQTENDDIDKISKETLVSFLQVQGKLIKTIDRLRREFYHERHLRHEIEEKYRHVTSRYEQLSVNNPFTFTEKINENKINDFDRDAEEDEHQKNIAFTGDHNLNQTVESVDITDLLNESQNSRVEEVEFNMMLQEYCHIESVDRVCPAAAICTTNDEDDRLSVLKTNHHLNVRMLSCCDIEFSSLSNWLTDILEEVELVLQSCLIGDALPREMIPKFKNLLEQMYKKQLSILLNKISSMEHELLILRKNNQELKCKSDFVMAELQEKDSIQKNIRIRLDKELSTNARLSDVNTALSDQTIQMKIDFTNQTSHLKDELDVERRKIIEMAQELKKESLCREKLETALSLSEERIKLVEQSNVELIKKSRQQADYQQKEIDSFNAEYAEIFRRCNNYKIQMETLQQNLQYQLMECEKTKSELHETIQSNTEYRDKMNEFIKIYQERRKKLETEVNELHQLLQISCRREITFVKENESLGVKCQSIKNICKDYEKKMKELENFINDLHLRHEQDRQEWLSMLNGTIDDKDKNDGILSQVNWLLKMLQLRIELLVVHHDPLTGGGEETQNNSLNRYISSEPCMLLQSIKSVQSMITMYLNNNQVHVSKISNGGSQSADVKNLNPLPAKDSVKRNNSSKRQKLTGSTDSLESISCSDSVSDHVGTLIHQNDIDSISTKIYIIQTNKIIELQKNLDHCERWRQQLIEQKKYIMSKLSYKLCNLIVTPLLTEEQKIIIKRDFFRFKFKSIIIVIIASIKFRQFAHTTSAMVAEASVSLSSRYKKVGSQLPQPKFSTEASLRSSTTLANTMYHSKLHTPSVSAPNTNSVSKSVDLSSFKVTDSKNNIKNSGSVTHSTNGVHRPHSSDIETRNNNSINKKNRSRNGLNPVPSVSPIHSTRSFNSSVSLFPKTSHKPVSSSVPAFSNSISVKKSSPLSANRKGAINQNCTNKSATFSNTLRQIEDFGKRLDKCTTDLANGV